MIVYDKLGDYLKSKNMKYIDLQRELTLSPSMTAKFTKNRIMIVENMSIEEMQIEVEKDSDILYAKIRHLYDDI
mgnify:CR=1 FL=1